LRLRAILSTLYRDTLVDQFEYANFLLNYAIHEYEGTSVDLAGSVQRKLGNKKFSPSDTNDDETFIEEGLDEIDQIDIFQESIEMVITAIKDCHTHAVEIDAKHWVYINLEAAYQQIRIGKSILAMQQIKLAESNASYKKIEQVSISKTKHIPTTGGIDFTPDL